MKPIKFKEQNIEIPIGEGVPYMPAFVDQSRGNNMPVVTVWKFENEKEKKAFLKTGKLYLTQMTNGGRFAAMNLTAKNPIITKIPDTPNPIPKELKIKDENKNGTVNFEVTKPIEEKEK